MSTSDVSGGNELSSLGNEVELLSVSDTLVSGTELSVFSVTAVNGATEETSSSSPFITLYAKKQMIKRSKITVRFKKITDGVIPNLFDFFLFVVNIDTSHSYSYIIQHFRKIIK